MPAEELMGVSGEPLEYPAPLFIRNTFIEAHPWRSPSFEEFFLERKVRSCPTSSMDYEANSREEDEEAATSPLAGAPGHREGSDCSTADTAEGLPKPIAAQSGAGLDTQAAPLPAGPVRLAPHPGDEAVPEERRLFRRAATWGSGLGSASHHSKASGHGVAPVEPGEVPGMSPASSSSLLGATPSEAIPSVGSVGHSVGRCKPCAFFNTKGCESGLECRFCHLCEPGEKKKRRKEKLQVRNAARTMRRLAMETFCSIPGARQSEDAD